MITIRVMQIPRRPGSIPTELDMPVGTTVLDVLRQLNIAAQGVLTAVDNDFVDEAFVFEKPCTLQIIAAVSGGGG